MTQFEQSQKKALILVDKVKIKKFNLERKDKDCDPKSIIDNK